MKIDIRLLNSSDSIPIDLLLLADPSVNIIRQYVSNGECYIARYNDITIGVLVLIKINIDTYEIANIAVREDFQRKGIGKKLIQFAIDAAKVRSAKSIEIGTGNSSIYQLILYQKCGFRISGIDPDFFTTHYTEPIYENGIQCRDMIRLYLNL